MSQVKPYKLPEEKTSVVSDSMAVRIAPNTDIATLRHNVMDAVYATTDQNALYSCLVFLSNQEQFLHSSVKTDFLNRLDELSRLSNGRVQIFAAKIRCFFVTTKFFEKKTT